MKPVEMVGTGGWGYLPSFTTDRLRSYAQRFQFVEVNVTFYRNIDPLTARRWRLKVPSEFEFSVKCNRELTHVHHLEPKDESYIIFDRMRGICRELRSRLLILQTPPSLIIDKAKIESLRQFFSSIDKTELTIGWELRGRLSTETRQRLTELLQVNGIVHVTDISFGLPLYMHELVYTRLFGRSGPKAPAIQFADRQLLDLRNKALELQPAKINYAFHSLGMYEDAERFINLVKRSNENLSS